MADPSSSNNAISSVRLNTENGSHDIDERADSSVASGASGRARSSPVASAAINSSPSAPGAEHGRHRRQTSEPPAVEDVGSLPADRPGYERHWSTTNVAGHAAGRGTRASTGGFPDIAQFHESWTNVDSNEFLGASVASFHESSASEFAVQIDRPELPTRSATSPKVDSAGVSSMIHDAARITDWDRVLTLCETNPECAKFAGRDGWTALHHACNRRCPRPEIAEALIKAYPGALTKEAENGWLPLHYACRFKAPKEFVRLLLHMQPEQAPVTVAKRDRMGRTPLYYAVRYDAPPGVVGLLLQVDPSVVLEEDQNEDSPLALVWDSWAEKLEGKRIVQSFLPGGFPEPDDTSVEQRAEMLRKRLKREPKLFKCWKKANMLLKAAFGFPVEEEEKSPQSQMDSPSSERRWRIVHATAAVKCHLSLFLLACALHPEQARELDESDLRRPGDQYVEGVSSHQTALHLAASSNAGGEPGKTVVISLLSLHRDAAEVQDGIDGSLPLHRMVENQRKQDWPNHAAILYHFYPRAVQISDKNGKLPLHRAAAAIQHAESDGSEEAQQRSVIIQLVRSFPQAASRADGSGCLPLHMIAMNGAMWDDGVEAVHNAHRNAVQVRAGRSLFNRLPIHLVSANPAAGESLVSRITQLHPRGSAVADGQGKLPLHLACEIGKEWDQGVRCLHEAFPGAIQQAEQNPRGWLPLHMASACPEASSDLIAQLVQLHPAAASVPDTHGRYPLHLACSSGKGWLGGLKTLFEANPSTISTADENGLLPLHVAAFLNCSKGGVKQVEVKNNDETDENNKSNEEPDLEVAAQLDVLFHILRADPTVLPSPGSLR